MIPSENLALVISVGLLIAIASATQDITVDALRIEQIGENEGKSMAAGAAMAVVGWWSGYKLGGVLSLFSAELLENIGFDNYWQMTFLILEHIIILMNIGLMFIKENIIQKEQSKQNEIDNLILNKFKKENFITKFVSWMSSTISGPIISFFKKNGFSIAISILSICFFILKLEKLFWDECL